MRVIAPPGPPITPAVYARGTLTSTFWTTNGAWSRIPFTPTHDTTGGGLTTGQFVVPSDGVYDISVGLSFWSPSVQPSAGDYINVAVRVNDVQRMIIRDRKTGFAGTDDAVGAGPLALHAGEVVEVWVYSTPSLPAYQEVSTFSVVRIGGLS